MPCIWRGGGGFKQYVQAQHQFHSVSTHSFDLVLLSSNTFAYFNSFVNLWSVSLYGTVTSWNLCQNLIVNSWLPTLQIKCKLLETQLLITASHNDVSVDHYFCFTNMYQWWTVTICSSLYTLFYCNFQFYYFIDFWAGLLLLSMGCFLLLETYLSL